MQLNSIFHDHHDQLQCFATHLSVATDSARSLQNRARGGLHDFAIATASLVEAKRLRTPDARQCRVKRYHTTDGFRRGRKFQVTDYDCAAEAVRHVLIRVGGESCDEFMDRESQQFNAMAGFLA